MGCSQSVPTGNDETAMKDTLKPCCNNNATQNIKTNGLPGGGVSSCNGSDGVTAATTAKAKTTNNKSPCCQDTAKDGFSYRKNTCALEYWEPLKLVGEGSISSIHLVRRRPQRVDVPYKERGEIMRAAESNTCSAVDNNNHKNNSQEQPQELHALKSIMKDHVRNDQYLEEMRNEIYTMSRMCHPNIVHVVEAFERKRHIYLIMEYCRGGDLCERQLEEAQVAVVIQKVLSAVEYMHRHKVVHRDLKLENIMFSEDPSQPKSEIKIIDFGLATKFLSNEYKRMTARVGTLYSMAPQVLQGVYDAKCDIWSIGVIAYVLLSGLQPFWGPPEEMSWEKRKKVMIDRIMRCEYMKLRGPSWNKVSAEAKSFVKDLLQMVPSRRPTAAKALKMPWILKYKHYKPNVMPSQSNQYAKKLELKRAAQVLLAQEVEEDTIVQLKETIKQQYDPHQKDEITIQQFRKALQQATQLSSEQLESLFRDDDGSSEPNQVRISYVGLLNDALDRKMRKQEDLIVNIFSQCGNGTTCQLSKAQLKSSLSEYNGKSEGNIAKALERILEDVTPDSTTGSTSSGNDNSNAPDATISCQQVIDRLHKLEMERVEIIRSCRNDDSKRSGNDSQANDGNSDYHDNGDDDASLSVDDLVDETNAVIPGGRRPDPNAAEPLFIYDDVSKSVRKYRKGQDLSESIISL